MSELSAAVPLTLERRSHLGACPDPGSDAACDTIAKSCSGFDRTYCRSYLSGMSDRGRQNLVKCMTESCGKGFLTCLQNLRERP